MMVLWDSADARDVDWVTFTQAELHEEFQREGEVAALLRSLTSAQVVKPAHEGTWLVLDLGDNIKLELWPEGWSLVKPGA